MADKTINKDFCKSMARNIEMIDGVKEIIVFTGSGNVYTHNIKSFAVKKAVLIFLFHHFTAMAAIAASQLTPVHFLAQSRSSKLIIGRLNDEIYVAVTGDPTFDHSRIFNYLLTCRESQG